MIKEKVQRIFSEKKMSLLASLPRNDVDLARAAAAGGADMLKVHLNVEHAASGTRFGTFAEERRRIEAIIAAVGIPVGIMPGAARTATLEEMRALASMGVAFYDIYVSDMPSDYAQLEEMAAMPALGSDWRPEDPAALAARGFNLLEASIINHADYGKPLAVSDLEAYSFIAGKFGGVVVVPTQKAIKPEEIADLLRAGVRGLMIGKIVTGDTPGDFEKAAARFAAAISSQ